MKALRVPKLSNHGRLVTYAALLGTRGAYILSRLLVALALPLVLNVEALGRFGVFSGLVAALPVVVAFGLPEHATRRLNRGLNRPIFRALVVQTVLGFFASFAISVLWLAVYPDIDQRMSVIVAGIVALTFLRGNLGMVLIGRGAVIRSNLTFALATSGPFFAIVAALILPRGSVDLTIVCLAWLVTCIIGIAIALPGSWRDLVDLSNSRFGRLPLLLVRQVRIIVGLRHLYINQIIDLARTYIDRMVLPLMAGFYLAGIYNVFALATSVAVMVPNALCGQVDLSRLVETARADQTAYRRIVAAGIVRAAVIAALMTAPLFLMKPAVDAILKLDLDPALYYVLCAGSMLSAMLAAVADYFWYAIYAARAERGLSRYAIPAILLSVSLLVGGIATFGLIGASLAVVITHACVVLFRGRVLAAHLARNMKAGEPVPLIMARLVPALDKAS